MNDNYATLSVALDAGVATVTVDHPPVNLLDAALTGDLDAFVTAVAEDPAVRVVVLRSADPEFFLAHGEMGMVADEEVLAMLADLPSGSLNPLQLLGQRFRALPQVTIAEIAGRARGGGAELAMAFDMAFAALDDTRLALPEVSLGMIPGGGGTQRLPRLTGRARALEAILGGDAFDAATAERYGWINRALPADELRPFVDRFARRIASYPAAAIAAATDAVDASALPLETGLATENELVCGVFGLPETARRTLAVLAAGAQTRDGERDLEALVAAAPWAGD
ncbi:putative enoyl-CoA hydratase echA8 [Baekduia alba]|uniref:enoyl-CoA hydratase/isomerase family protein n=1 Tax=Baekduia alba TaxID=2997333 RepID=UPI002341A701|nr:enoyl-CoA hydratase/isomerase family protein [Baekduia alba]WCB95321.1 putative enoyl-CoA hydratase echA8 [Baekduia alba]